MSSQELDEQHGRRIGSACAQAGSSDVKISITGSNFDNQFLHTSVAFWTTNSNNLHDTGKMLRTTFISSSQLTALIPAALLQNPTSVQIVVLTEFWRLLL